MSKHMVRERGVGHPNTFVNGAMQGAEASRQEPTPSISAVLTEYRLSPSLPNQRFVSGACRPCFWSTRTGLGFSLPIAMYAMIAPSSTFRRTSDSGD